MDDDAPDDVAAPIVPEPAPSPPGGEVLETDDREHSTEWFSVEDYLALDDYAPALPRRQHRVTTIVVSHDGAVWLPAVLTTLAKQTRSTDDAVGVDAASSDTSADLLRTSLGGERTVQLDGNPGFGAAVRAGLAHLAETSAPPRLDPFTREPIIEWLWLLHDDSAPDVNCLAALLDTADDNPSAAILGPKILGWHDRRLLLEAGVTVTGSGRRVTGLERREHDQGQHDGVRDVLAVSSAGMLVRRDVWDALEGFDPALPLFRDDLDFCWRAHRRGERVLVATDAVLHHREASAHGRRIAEDPPRPHRADREAAVHVLLSHPGRLAAPFVAFRLLLGSLVRALISLLGKDVVYARDELGAVSALAFHPSRVRDSRALVARTTTEPPNVVRSLRVGAAAQARGALETIAGIATTSASSAPSSSVSALDSGPIGDDVDFMDQGSPGLARRVFLRSSVLLTAVLVIVAIIGTRGLWLGDGVLQGGALLPPPPGAEDLWETFRRAWHDVGPGSTTTAPPYLAVIAFVAFILLGKAPVAVTVLLLLAIPLAGWSAYIALRGLVPNRVIRAWAGAAYALLPAMTGATASGRIGTTIAAIVLPFAIRSLVRISGTSGTYRRAAGTALLVAVVLAATPAVWVVLLIAGVGAAIAFQFRGGRNGFGVVGRLTLALLGPFVLLLPWSTQFVTNPSTLLIQPGIVTSGLTDPELTPWDVLLLHPGGPGMSPLWLTIGIVLAGLLALLRRDRLSVIVPFLALAAVALTMGVLQSIVLVVPPGSTMEVRPWPGPATLVMGLCLVAAAAVGTQDLRARMGGASFSIGQPVAAVIAVLAILAPILSAVWFGTGLPMPLRKAPASSVPAFVAADADSAQAPRTLVLDAGPDVVRYSMLTGPGPVLGDAETGPPAEVWQQIDPLVAAMASGRGGDEIAALAGYGVRYVILANGSSQDLVPTLDAEPGLRRLSSAGGEVLWRVAGVTSRARVVEGDKASTVGLADHGTVTADPYLDQKMPDGGAGRSLVIGAAADPGWRAVMTAADGSTTDLAATAGPGLQSWSQAFTVPAGTPRVTVDFDDTSRVRWLWFEGLLLAVLVIMALPSRRRFDPDPDIDEPVDAAITEEAAPVQVAVADVGDAVERETDEGVAS